MSPRKSLRRRSSQLNLPMTSMRRLMSQEGYKHFKPIMVNELSDNDMVRRASACEEMLTKLSTLRQRQSVLFTDECAIYLSSKPRNIYFWSKSNPRYYEELQQHPPHVMLWAGVTSTHVVGPYFFPAGGVNSDRYMDMLEHWLIPELYRLGIVIDAILQQDGAPAHFSISVREFLTTQFPLWIGRGGPLAWPPRSPDLTTCDNWLWSFVKEQVSSKRLHSIDELKQAVRDAFGQIKSIMLKRACRRTWRRIQLCKENDGIHTDTLDL